MNDRSKTGQQPSDRRQNGAATTYLGRGMLPSDQLLSQKEDKDGEGEEGNEKFAENNKIGWKDGLPVIISRGAAQQQEKVTGSDTKALDDMLFNLERNYIMNPVHNRQRPIFNRTSCKTNESMESRVVQKMSRKPAFSKVQVCDNLTQETQNDEEGEVIIDA